MRVDGNYGSTPGYEPNHYGEWEQQPEFADPPLPLDGAADHWDFRADDDDYFTQPRLLFNLMSAEQKQVLFENTARALGNAPKAVKQRHICNCLKVAEAYGEGVEAALGVEFAEECE